MSNFDELFNSVENTEMVKDLLSDSTFSKLRSGVVEALARDSKIKLVTPYDKERPLDTGAYWYDSAENTLYVGAGDFQTLVNIIDFLTHETSILYIPAPRITTYVDVTVPTLSYHTEHAYIPTPRLQFTNTVDMPILASSTSSKRTNLFYHDIINIVNNVETVVETEVLHE